MAKNFFQLDTGDLLYYVTLEKSVLTSDKNINVGVVKDLEPTENPYELIIILEDGKKVVVSNWNCDTTKVVNDDKLSDTFMDSITEPISATFYSTDEELLKDAVRKNINSLVKRLSNIERNIEKEILRLSETKYQITDMKAEKKGTLILEPITV